MQIWRRGVSKSLERDRSGAHIADAIVGLLELDELICADDGHGMAGTCTVLWERRRECNATWVIEEARWWEQRQLCRAE